MGNVCLMLCDCIGIGISSSDAGILYIFVYAFYDRAIRFRVKGQRHKAPLFGQVYMGYIYRSKHIRTIFE